MFQQRFNKVLTLALKMRLSVMQASSPSVMLSSLVNGPKLNAKKQQFKSNNSYFFSHNQTLDGLKADESQIENKSTKETDLNHLLDKVNYLA